MLHYQTMTIISLIKKNQTLRSAIFKCLFAPLFLAMLLFSPAQANFDFDRGAGNIKDLLSDIEMPKVLPIATSTPSADEEIFQQKEWTVMFFINGNNDLMPYASYNLGQISSIGTTDEVNMVVEMGLANWNEEGSVVSRMLVNKGTPDMPNTVIYDVQENRDMGDYRNVVDFAKWAMKKFPAKRYMLVMENHGGGVDDVTMEESLPNKGISYDHVSRNFIKTSELRQMMSEIGKVDVFLMSACLMQMAEVAYEVKDYSDMIIASENTDHGFAFFYKEKLAALTDNPTASTEEISTAFLNAHKKFYASETLFNPLYGLQIPNSTMGHTLSAIKSSALNDLPAQLNAWTEAVKNANEPDSILHAVKNVLRLGPINEQIKYVNTYADLGHFVKLISEKSKDENVKKVSARLLEYITKNLVYAQNGMHKTEFYNFEDSTGIAIKMIMMLPMSIIEIMPEWNDQFLTQYADFNLSKDSNWDEFLDWLQKAYLAASADSKTENISALPNGENKQERL